MTRPQDSTALAPWSFFQAHEGKPFAFFLDRAGRSEPSFAGSHPTRQLVVDGTGQSRCWQNGRWESVGSDPIESIARFVEDSEAVPSPLPAWLEGCTLARTVGYLAYELGTFVERTRSAPVDFLHTPLAVLSTYDTIQAWDPASGATARVTFDGETRGPVPEEIVDAAGWAWMETERAEYDRGFERIRAAIAAGDIYQANLSRRALFAIEATGATLYRRLRAVQPVPYGAFLDFGGFQLLSNSPECFLERRGDNIRTLPIKGTRPRHETRSDDLALQRELVLDAKERAEHLMIVDLERNDLGRVATTGSVQVTGFAQVESYATVHHMVSEIRATLRCDVGLAELLRATFPGGSITGAPKIAAIDLLAQIERYTRGPYTGAIGMFNGGEALELSVAIRTAVVEGNRASYSAGGGIVADSDCDREWAESELKIAAFRACLQQTPSTETATP